MIVYISGATGYIGSKLIESLNQHTCITVKTIGRSDQCDIYWDMSSNENNAVLEHGATFVHLAGVSNESEFSADEIDQLNRQATHDLAIMSRTSKANRFIFMSTCAVYSPSSEKITESTIAAPKGPYGTSKYRAEEDLKSVFNHTDTKLWILRPSSVYGLEIKPSQSTLGILRNLLKKRKFIFFGPGNNIKSFVHVNDVVNAIMHIIELGEDSLVQDSEKTYILSSESLKTSELINTLVEQGEHPIPFSIPLKFIQLLNNILLHTPIISTKAAKIQKTLNKWKSNFDIDGGKITKTTGFKYTIKLTESS